MEKRISAYRRNFQKGGKTEGLLYFRPFSTEWDISVLESAVLWILKSSVRPGRRRKNCYVDVIPQASRFFPRKSRANIWINRKP